MPDNRYLCGTKTYLLRAFQIIKSPVVQCVKKGRSESPDFRPSLGSQNRAQVYRCRSPEIKGKPPSFVPKSHMFAKDVAPMRKTKEKN